MSDSFLSGYLHLEEILRQQIEQNLCCNFLYIQVENLFKKFSDTEFAPNFMDLKVPKLPDFQSTGLFGIFWGSLLCFSGISFVF